MKCLKEVFLNFLLLSTLNRYRSQNPLYTEFEPRAITPFASTARGSLLNATCFLLLFKMHTKKVINVKLGKIKLFHVLDFFFISLARDGKDGLALSRH